MGVEIRETHSQEIMKRVKKSFSMRCRLRFSSSTLWNEADYVSEGGFSFSPHLDIFDTKRRAWIICGKKVRERALWWRVYQGWNCTLSSMTVRFTSSSKLRVQQKQRKFHNSYDSAHSQKKNAKQLQLGGWFREEREKVLKISFHVWRSLLFTTRECLDFKLEAFGAEFAL